MSLVPGYIPPANPFSARELVFDELLNTYRVKTVEPPTQRKPETGERLNGTATPRSEFPCYYCHRVALLRTGDQIPMCHACAERWRRRNS